MIEQTNDDTAATEKRRKLVRKALVRFLVWKEGPLSRGKLARTLSLNLPTVSSCVNELVAAGELAEEGYEESTGGRKPQLLDVRPERMTVVGLTFSSRGISSAWADMKGNLNNLRIYPFQPGEGRQRALDTIHTAITEQMESAQQARGHKPVQIGMGVSGLLDASTGVSHLFPRFDEWSDVPLGPMMTERFGVPTIVDNHIAAIALAETVFGNNRGLRNGLYIQLGPGVGAGIVIDGRIYRGSKLSVGEFGHTTVGGSDLSVLCYCGNYGCLEAVAGDYALVQQAEAAIRESVKTRIPECASVPGRITPGAVFRAAQQGDRFAMNLVEKVAQLLGTGIANLVNLYGPETIILGGTMAQAGEIMLEPISRTMRKCALEPMQTGIQITRSSFGNDEAIKGAVTLALYQHLTKDLGGWLARDPLAEAI